MELRERQQRAINRAIALGGARAALPLGDGLYQVAGRRGDLYGVRVEGHQTWCSCDAGAARTPCWHQAAAWMRNRAENMHLSEYRPAPVADTAKAERRAKAAAFLRLLA